MRVLVTGSSGQVGAAIAARLLSEGHQVVGLSRGLTRSNRSLSRALAVDLGQAGAAQAIAARLSPCDAVVHSAATLAREPFAPEISLTNCLGTQQVVELASGWEVSSLVYISSLLVIGRPRALPVTEEHPSRPATAYHASKLYGEELVRIADEGGVPGVSMRLTAPVGPGTPDGRIMSTFVSRALAEEPLLVAGEGTRGQDYVDVRDVAEATLACLQHRARGLLNIGSGRCVNNLQLARRCVETLGSGSDIRVTGVPEGDDDIRWEVSIDRARSAIGYVPERTLEDSIIAVAEERSGRVAHA